jgi:site-specific recombinase XerD
MKTETDFARYVTRFLSSYLPYERNVSKNTVASYRDAFVSFIGFIRNEKKIKLERLTLKDVTKNNILDWLDWLTKNGASMSTRNYRLAAMHSFVTFLQYEDVENLVEWQRILTIRSVKTEKHVPVYYTVDGIKLLFSQPDTNTYQGLRHLAILSLMYDSACRVQELTDLTVDSLRIQSEPYTIRICGKGRKTRVVPLSENQLVVLRKYMDRYGLNDEKCLKYPLFTNSRGDKMTRSGITYILKKYADMARLVDASLIPEKASCHQIRHSKAMHLLQAGVCLIWIRDVLGHTSVQTTEIYARADNKQKRDALEKAYSHVLPNNKKDGEWHRNQDLLNWLKSLNKN